MNPECLENCPFCNAPAELTAKRESTWRAWAKVQCTGCPATMEIIAKPGQKLPELLEEAIQKWNQRSMGPTCGQ